MSESTPLQGGVLKPLGVASFSKDTSLLKYLHKSGCSVEIVFLPFDLGSQDRRGTSFVMAPLATVFRKLEGKGERHDLAPTII